MTDTLPPTDSNLARAAEIIRAGGLVAFPTETVYGLGADAFNPSALAKIFAAKGRPTADPLIVHICEVNQLELVTGSVSDEAMSLVEEFWPGPLTLVLPRGEQVPDLITAGLGSVAVRLPDHPVALALLRKAGVPIAAPSANLFGHTSPTTAAHVLADLDGRVDLIIDGGATRVGVESTVLDMTSNPARILRHGGVSQERIEQVIGTVDTVERNYKPTEGLPSPGLLAKHYAPYTPMYFYKNDTDGQRMYNAIYLKDLGDSRLGAMVFDDEAERYEALGLWVYRLGSRFDHAAVASHIYNALRWFDDQKVDAIYCHGVDTAGIGRAINDRLLRAASQVVE